jgi:hypothetical protein
MQDRIVASDTPVHLAERRRRRRGAIGACVALAVALHLAFLDGIVGAVRGAPQPAMTPMSVRTVAAGAEAGTEDAVIAPPTQPPAAPLSPVAGPSPQRRPRAFAAVPAALTAAAEASASSTNFESPPSPAPDVPAVASDRAAIPAIAAGELDTGASGPPERTPQLAGASTSITFPGIGDQPPPLYRTQLPPPATLHYQVRRGFLRGEGEIRWQPSSDGYRLVLEARIAGLTLLLQTSEGAIDADGLAPVRFVDQRARRSAQSANFVRDAGHITFSGTALEWPLVPGSQDRLSWMIQLAGIAAAQPELLTEGGRITMAVVGARGDASIWTLRYVGIETVETANGSVRAIKLAREARYAYDTNAEIWLDPERAYLPAHATLRNSAGVSEYDLLLDRIGP